MAFFGDGLAAGPDLGAAAREAVDRAVEPLASDPDLLGMGTTLVAIAPMPATAAGTAEPTARNLEATATPHDSPSAERATIEKVMAPT